MCLSILIAASANAQCGNTLQSITYDTVIIGTGNDVRAISLSQFDPSIGTLVSAKLNSTISVNYGFTLKNVEAVQRDFAVSVGRYDYFTSTALSTPYTNITNTSVGDFVLNPGDSISKPPFTVLYRYSQNDSVTTDVVNFLGNNNVAFNYKTITYTNLTGSNVYYYSAIANDTVHFSVTYYYCDNTILPNDIVSFFADKENNETINLSWSTTGSQQGVNYEIQKGFNSTQLSSIDSVAGINNSNQYSYNYKIDENPTGKIYFRLKFTNASGEIKYSEIKAVDISDIEGSIKAFVYPNPVDDYINVHLSKNDWDIKVFSDLGTLVQQNYFSNTSLAHISFKTKLPAGTYFIKAQSITTNISRVLSFVVR